MNTESRNEYEQRERKEFSRQVAEAVTGSLGDRKESAESMRQAMAEQPELVAQRVLWMLQGAYGFGAGQAAQEVAANTRMNRAAWMVQTIGAIEWQSQQRRTIAAWKTLTKAQQDKLAAVVMAEVTEYLADQQAE